MISLRQSEERFHTDLGWLDSRHTFSFGDHHDPRHMGFRSLRVINEDRVQGGQGFGTHPHRDMEILSYVLEGALAHKDSLGNGSVIRPGEVQRMTAGTGVLHSEHNPEPSAPVHFLQIWIQPARRGLPPSYEQKVIPEASARGLKLVAAPEGEGALVTVHQEARLYAGHLDEGQSLTHRLQPGRAAWVQVAAGEIQVNGQGLKAGDGAAISEEAAVELRAGTKAHLLLFDL
jgi:redox-sensitive bicupin YhaK (pirin superfamily)